MRKVAASALVGLALAPAALAGGPALELVARAPLTLRGVGFHPRERVTVTATTGKRARMLIVSSGRAGRFLAVFRSLLLPRCGSFGVVAVGSRGDRAVYRPPRARC